MEQVRAFIAVELPEYIKASLRRMQDLLKARDPSCAKWVNPDSIHLTLKFLGNVAVDKIDPIACSLRDAAQSVPPFQLEVKSLGAFPNLRRVQVVWAGLGGDLEKLAVLQKNVECNLAELGFPPEGRAFSPHLTLARLHNYTPPEQRQALGTVIAGIKNESNLIIDVHSISLMQSQLTRAGAIYTRLFSAEL